MIELYTDKTYQPFKIKIVLHFVYVYTVFIWVPTLSFDCIGYTCHSCAEASTLLTSHKNIATDNHIGFTTNLSKIKWNKKGVHTLSPDYSHSNRQKEGEQQKQRRTVLLTLGHFLCFRSLLSICLSQSKVATWESGWGILKRNSLVNFIRFSWPLSRGLNGQKHIKNLDILTKTKLTITRTLKEGQNKTKMENTGLFCWEFECLFIILRISKLQLNLYIFVTLCK